MGFKNTSGEVQGNELSVGTSEQIVYKEYETPNGKVQFTKEQWDSLVDNFRLLNKWNNELPKSK